MDVAHVADLWRERLHIDVRREFNSVEAFELWRCKQCDLMFFVPENIAGSPDLYSQLSGFDWYSRAQKWEYEIAIKDLQGCRVVLEVGCASGNFLKLAREQLGVEVRGLELNPKAVSESVRQGFCVKNLRVEELAARERGKYDAVCAFQVLEHLPSVRGFLEACCLLLGSGGKLLVGVPNARSYIRNLESHFDLPPHHMTRWTKASLLSIQSHLPLKLSRLAYEPLPEYQVEWYMEACENVVRAFGLGHLVHPWIRSRANKFVREGRIRAFLRGETLYASFVRV